MCARNTNTCSPKETIKTTTIIINNNNNNTNSNNNNNNNKCIYNADPSPHPFYYLKLAINLLSANTHTNKCIYDADPSPHPCPSRKRD